MVLNGKINKKTTLNGTLGANPGSVSITVDTALSSTSENPVQNKVIKAALDEKADQSSVNALMSAFEVVDDYEALLSSTAHTVLVRHNDGEYGDGGECLFEVTAESTWTIPRSNGTYVRPLMNQGDLIQQNTDIKELLRLCSGYVGNSALTFGGDHTMFDDTCTDEINCSTFVSAILQGISYENSRYALGSGASNVIGVGTGSTHLPDSSSLLSGQMASFFAQHKQLFSIPEDPSDAVGILQPGDLLFSGPDDGTRDSCAWGIGHVAVVLATSYPTYNYIVVAQAGGSPSAITDSTLNTTTGNIAIIKLNTAERLRYCKAFARPNYGYKLTPDGENLVSTALGNAYYFDVSCVPGVFIDGTYGKPAYGASWSGDMRLHAVSPGITITNESTLPIGVALYTADYEFVRRVTANASAEITVGANEYYARFMIYTTDLDSALKASIKALGGGSSITVDSALSSTSENPVQNKAVKSALDAKADKLTEVTVSTAGAVTQALDAGKIYHFNGALIALTITLNAPASGDLAQYHFDFLSGSSAPTLTMPNTITMPDSFSVEASKRYEVDILNNYGAVVSWANF